jgi:hypothetical protein
MTDGSPKRDPLTLDDLVAMDGRALHAVLEAGHPLDPDVLAERQYLGVDLSLPGWARRILWHTFRKTFHRDPETGHLRGWNVKMEQRGFGPDQVPLTDRKGAPITFGHYIVRPADGVRFPKAWRGGHFLDYGAAGNRIADPAALGYTPLVAVNPGSMDLLLGWEVFRIGPAMLPLPLYWALRFDGPLDAIVPVPRPRASRGALPDPR